MSAFLVGSLGASVKIRTVDLCVCASRYPDTKDDVHRCLTSAAVQHSFARFVQHYDVGFHDRVDYLRTTQSPEEPKGEHVSVSGEWHEHEARLRSKPHPLHF